MTIRELRQLSHDVLASTLKEERSALRALVFSAKQKQLKRVREIRRVRTLIAQLATLVREQHMKKK